MARSDEQNRLARERAKEALLDAATHLFAERGVHGATVADITRSAGVAQGLVNYHFGSKDRLVAELVDRWFSLMVSFPEARPGTADDRLRGIVDSSLQAAAENMTLHRAVLAMQQDPTQRPFFVEAAERNSAAVTAAEDAVREIFRERGAADPALEEVMLRTVLEGVVVKSATGGDAFPLAAARRWVLARYGLDG
ncbi:TetR/AcrR family transcriptional regulator [Microbacterium gilvum]|uniref:HTH tetR-type domain-containing protein n=1 Tax=Microbacterium gilvum TaxID=1336204 RepID=A0ABP8ZYP5_9MICO